MAAAARSPAPARRAARAPAGPARRAATKAVPQAPGGPAVKLQPSASKDPRLQKVLDQVAKSAADEKRHAPAADKVADAQAAAVPPANEKLAGAQVNQVA